LAINQFFLLLFFRTHRSSQHAEEIQKTHAALAALQKSLDLKEQACQAAAIDSQEADARVNDAEQARLSAVSIAEQHFLYAKQANDRANSFEQQAKHAQLAAQQAQHDAQQKASRVGELKRLVEQLMQQVLQVLALHQAHASHLGIVAQTGRDKRVVHWSGDTLPAMPNVSALLTQFGLGRTLCSRCVHRQWCSA